MSVFGFSFIIFLPSHSITQNLINESAGTQKISLTSAYFNNRNPLCIIYLFFSSLLLFPSFQFLKENTYQLNLLFFITVTDALYFN